MKFNNITALDIGSGSVKGLCCRRDKKAGSIEVLALSEEPCFGVRNGEVVKPDQVTQAIIKVKAELEQKADCKIKDVLVNIGGSHLFSIISQGVVSVSRADQKISQEDVQRVLKAAEAVNLPSNKEVLDSFPKDFMIDGEEGIKDPIGLGGIRLEAKVILICIFSPILENLEKALEASNLHIEEVLLDPLACSRAVLTKEQKELGVVLVDLGFSTTSVSVFEKGEMVDFAIFPIGSSHITNDIAIGLRTEIQTAENIKKEFATLKGSLKKGSKDKIKILDKDLEFSKKFLQDIVESRVGEIFSEVQKSLKKISGEEPLPCGVVLTGGGSKMPGIVEFAKQKFKLPCQLGRITAIKSLEDERFATVAGLTLGAEKVSESKLTSRPRRGVKEILKKVFKVFLP